MSHEAHTDSSHIYFSFKQIGQSRVAIKYTLGVRLHNVTYVTCEALTNIYQYKLNNAKCRLLYLIFVVRCESKNIHQKDTCLCDIGLHARILLRILDSIANIIGIL